MGGSFCGHVRVGVPRADPPTTPPNQARDTEGRAHMRKQPLVMVAIVMAFANVSPTVASAGSADGTGRRYNGETLVATQAPSWVRRYNGPGNGDDSGGEPLMSPDGGVAFVTGSSLGAGTGTDIVTVAYNASTGATLWARRYN